MLEFIIVNVIIIGIVNMNSVTSVKEVNKFITFIWTEIFHSSLQPFPTSSLQGKDESLSLTADS